ncbi:MAG: glycosyltransferase family 4 protein, partial [Chloroflexaceae bacterium]|nr:glycosyltransferase family 4 protein [Chloroflexaceae bacterium]
MTLRVAHVTATFPPYRGGTGNVCYHNARELAWRGHMVEVITAAVPGAPALEERDGFTIRRLRPLLRVGNAPVLPGLLHALQGFDLIHLHYPFFGGELTTLAAALRRTPLVITYHQDVFLPGVMGLIATSLRHTLGRATLRHATRLLFTSADYGRASYVRPMLGGREWTLGELPNGVDVRRFCPGPADQALRLRHGLQPDDHVLLLVAGLDQAHAFKGVAVLLQALTRLSPTFKAVLVGDGDMRDGYVASAAALGLGQRVVFAGRVSDDDLPNYYRSADVTVLPSVTMGEAFGLVLVESFACGTPVIASNLPGVRTVVQHGQDGLLVAPGEAAALADAIQQLCQHPDRGATMGQRGRQRVER